MNKHVLEVTDLSVDYTDTDGMTVHAVRGVSFFLDRGEVLGIIGRSGSGKSTLLSALAGVLSFRARMTAGRIILNGTSLTGEGFPDRKAHQRFLQSVRGKQVAVIFQKPENYMDPTMRIESQLVETGLAHTKIPLFSRRKYAVDLLEKVGIYNKNILGRIPAELSGGQIQKIAIAMALAHSPDVLLADEPFSALDAESRKEMISLFQRIAAQGTSVILSAHDLEAAEGLCTRILVFDDGEIVEQGSVADIMEHPVHACTKELISAYRLIRKEGNTDEKTI